MQRTGSTSLPCPRRSPPAGIFLALSLAALGLVTSGCCGKIRSMARKKSGETAATAGTTAPTPRAAAGPQPLPGPVTLTFGSNDVTVSTGGKGRMLTFDKDGRLMMNFSGLPWGTKLQAGTEEITTDTGKPSDLRPDIRAALGAAKADIGTTFDPQLTLTLTLPDGRSGSGAVPPQRLNTYALGQLLQSAEGKGLTFEGETPDSKRDTAFLVAGSRVIGRKGLVRDIDLVVTLKKGKMKGSKNCSGYKTKDGVVRSVILELFEGEALAFDRRTGAEVARKTLPPNTTCPMTLYQAKDDPTADSNLPYAAAEKWALTLLKK